jgi:hypothetical protein
MTLPVIGLLGCGGAVGSAAVEFLEADSGIRLRGGRRHVPERHDGNFEIMAVDAEDCHTLARFCDGCRIVVNCAGPSFLIGDRVARAAAAAGADYVDAFGGVRLERQLTSWMEPDGPAFIVSAGVFPGLSGLLPRWLARQDFDQVERLRVFAGGREHCTAAGGADVLLSALDGFGTPGAVWADGRVLVGSVHALENAEIPGFPGRVHAQPFLSREMERIAYALGLAGAEWYNVTSSPLIPETIARVCGRLEGGENLAEAVAELVRIADLEMAGRAPYYVMAAEMAGRRQGRAANCRVVLRAADSYRLSGAVAALAGLHLLEGKTAAGVHRAAELLDPERVVKRIASLKDVDLRLVETSPWDETMEEGLL